MAVWRLPCRSINANATFACVGRDLATALDASDLIDSLHACVLFRKYARTDREEGVAKRNDELMPNHSMLIASPAAKSGTNNNIF